MQKILIHGLGQKSSSWENVLKLSADSSQISCPDLWPMVSGEEYTYENIYNGFKDYCNQFCSLLNLCGLSLGAVLALNYAIDYPEKIQSLVLIGAQYKMPKGLLKIQNIIFRFIPSKAFSTMGMPKKNVLELTNSMMDLNFAIKLKDISCATLVVCGENDKANSKAARELSDNIQTSKLVFVENAGHEVNVDKPQMLAEILDTFWATV